MTASVRVPRKAQPLVKVAERFGFVLTRRNRHLVFHHPNGAMLVASATASDRRALLNMEHMARRALAQHRP